MDGKPREAASNIQHPAFSIQTSIGGDGAEPLQLCASESMWLPHQFLASLCARQLITLPLALSLSVWVRICVSVLGRSCLRRSFVNEHAVNKADTKTIPRPDNNRSGT